MKTFLIIWLLIGLVMQLLAIGVIMLMKGFLFKMTDVAREGYDIWDVDYDESDERWWSAYIVIIGNFIINIILWPACIAYGIATVIKTSKK